MSFIVANHPFVSSVKGLTAKTSFAGFLGLARQRRQLRDLDTRMLEDIGLTYDAAMAEAKRPFWDVPGYWRA